MKRTILRGASLILGLGLSVSASAATLEEVLTRLVKAESEIRTLQFDYTQTTTLSVGARTSETRGKAKFERPNRFRVEMGPEGQQIISDGKALWIYFPGRRQALRDSMDNWARTAGFPQGLTPFQMKVAQMKERYTFALVENGTPPVLALSPKNTEGPTYTLRLWVDMKTGLAEKTELVSDTVTAVVKIQNAIVNPSMPRGTFRFVPPEGTDVLDMPLQHP